MTGLALRHTSISDGNLALHTVTTERARLDALRNRRIALEGLGLDLDDLAVGEQVHGARVRRVGLAERGRGARSAGDALRGTDGLVTNEPGIALMVLCADCPPVCLFDPCGPGVAVLHAGWRGLEAGVLERGLESLGAQDPAKVRAFLGACAGPCCYEVGGEFAARFPGGTVRVGGRTHLDLPRVVSERLGLEVERVGPRCTVCEGRAFSHRASGTPGRHALLAALTGLRNP